MFAAVMDVFGEDAPRCAFCLKVWKEEVGAGGADWEMFPTHGILQNPVTMPLVMRASVVLTAGDGNEQDSASAERCQCLG